MKAKKNTLATAMLAVMMCATLLGCPEAQEMLEQVVTPPTVAVSQVRFTGISSQAVDLDLAVDIDNPNPIGLSLSGVDYDFQLAGRPLAAGSSSSGIELKAQDKSQAQFPVSLAYNEILNIYKAVQGQDEVPYQLSGKVYITTPIGELPIPFQGKGKLPVLRPPEIKDVKLDVDNLSLTGADLLLSIKLFNPNAFALNVKDGNYALALDGKSFSSGNVGRMNVPAKSTGSVDTNMSLDFLSLGSWAYTLLSGGEADYSLDYAATYLVAGHPVKQEEKKQGTAKIR